MSKKDFYNIKTYMNDYNIGLVENAPLGIKLCVPFSPLFVGKSKSGKTTLLLDILNQWNGYTTDESGKYCKRMF